MTKQMKQHIDCPHCGRSIPEQDNFQAWVKGHPELDSCRIGITVSDVDLIIHRFKVDHCRDCQYIMMVEKKCYGKEPEDWQRDTLNIVGQFLRNDKKTPYKGRRAQVENRSCKVYSTIKKRDIIVKAFGYHLLQFQKTSPGDSEWIKWDKKKVTEDVLVSLLRFDLHPETLKSMDLRPHHAKDPQLFILPK